MSKTFAETVKQPPVSTYEGSTIIPDPQALTGEHTDMKTSQSSGKQKHQRVIRTPLQKHADFFDRNKDGIITPLETYQGFRILGFNVFLSIFAVLVINGSFSLVCNKSWFLIDPFFRIWISEIQRGKHGSDTSSYDSEGNFVPENFDQIFQKWDVEQREALNLWQLWKMVSDLKNAFDFFGWFAARFEWFAVWLLCSDQEGYVSKEKIKGIYDGSLFYRIEQENRDMLQSKQGGLKPINQGEEYIRQKEE